MALDPKVEAFLTENPPRFAVLATINPDGSVQQTVMWYLVRDGKIVMNTAKGRKKDRNILRDGRISICVEDGYRFVTISGTATLDDDPVRTQADIAECAVRYVGPEQAKTMIDGQFGKEARLTYILEPENVIANGL
jgi:PPOX class probable F420-dependent enzyme